MANILLIGGSGFVSGEMARTALCQGHSVWTVTRGQRELPAGLHGLVADRKDSQALRAALRGAGAQFDLAVDCIPFVPEDARQDVEVLRDVVRHLVLISTDFVYDPARRRFPQPRPIGRHRQSHGAARLRRGLRVRQRTGQWAHGSVGAAAPGTCV